MNKICIISIGKIKTSYFKAAASEYIQRLKHVWQIEEIALRDSNSRLPMEKRILEEGERILSALLPAHEPICLDERGKTFASVQFSEFIRERFENKTKYPCFIIGGSYGLAKSVKEKCTHMLGLGPMTLPHELAQVLLLEQLYRAHTILASLPYHHI